MMDPIKRSGIVSGLVQKIGKFQGKLWAKGQGSRGPHPGRKPGMMAHVMRKRLAKMAPPAAPRAMGVIGK